MGHMGMAGLSALVRMSLTKYIIDPDQDVPLCTVPGSCTNLMQVIFPKVVQVGNQYIAVCFSKHCKSP